MESLSCFSHVAIALSDLPLFLPSASKGPSSYMGLTQIIKDNLPVLRSITLLPSAKFLLPCKVTHSWVPGMKPYTSLGLPFICLPQYYTSIKTVHKNVLKTISRQEQFKMNQSSLELYCLLRPVPFSFELPEVRQLPGIIPDVLLKKCLIKLGKPWLLSSLDGSHDMH